MSFKVFGAIGETFAFLFRNILSVLHVIWLPSVLQIAAYLGLAPGFLQASTNLSADPPADGPEAFARLAPHIAPMVLFTLLAIVLSVMLTTGLARLALRNEKPKLPFLLVWGKDEWRVLACIAIIAACGCGVALVYWLFTLVSALLLSSGPIASMLAIAGAIAIALGGIYIWVRLCLFTPATVAEGKIGIRASYEKTEDLFWPLFGFWVLWILMFMVVQFLTFGFVTPPAYFEVMRGADFTSPEALRQTMRDANAAMAAGYDISDMGNVIRMTITYLLQLVASVLFALASIVAWKRLTDETQA